MIFDCFKKKDPNRPRVLPTPIETPTQAQERYDGVDRGNARNPDWRYLASTIQLDSEQSKLDNMAWYYRQYKLVSHELRAAAIQYNIPKFFLMGIDMREMSFNHSGHFANGDKIIGTGRKTYRVPAGLGPAATWVESVGQAIDHERSVNSRFKELVNAGMGFADALEAWEVYNGLGFRSKGEYSEYVFAFTNHHDETGRYVADGKFKKNSKVTRCGAAAFVLFASQHEVLDIRRG